MMRYFSPNRGVPEWINLPGRRLRGSRPPPHWWPESARVAHTADEIRLRSGGQHTLDANYGAQVVRIGGESRQRGRAEVDHGSTWSNGRGSGRWAGCALPGNPVKITQRTFWD